MPIAILIGLSFYLLRWLLFWKLFPPFFNFLFYLYVLSIWKWRKIQITWKESHLELRAKIESSKKYRNQNNHTICKVYSRLFSKATIHMILVSSLELSMLNSILKSSVLTSKIYFLKLQCTQHLEIFLLKWIVDIMFYFIALVSKCSYLKIYHKQRLFSIGVF